MKNTITNGKKKHSVGLKVKCSTCLKEFSSNSCLNKHVKIVHRGIKPYSCDICGEKFTELNVVKTHKSKKHTGVPLPRNHKCMLCGKSFTRSSILHNHLRSHGEKKYSCDHCGKAFPHQKKLDRHLTTHVNEKEFQCSECHRCFLTKSNMERHAKTHLDEKPHKCEKCGKRFRQSGNLKIHQRTHTGEKPYKCETCGLCFAQKVNLKHHKYIHVKVSPYECNLCKKKFRQPSNLKLHVANVHKPLPVTESTDSSLCDESGDNSQSLSVVVSESASSNNIHQDPAADTLQTSNQQSQVTNADYSCRESGQYVALNTGDEVNEQVCNATEMVQGSNETFETQTFHTNPEPSLKDADVLQGPQHNDNLQMVADLAYKQQQELMLPSVYLPTVIQNMIPQPSMQKPTTLTNLHILPCSQTSADDQAINFPVRISSPYTYPVAVQQKELQSTTKYLSDLSQVKQFDSISSIQTFPSMAIGPKIGYIVPTQNVQSFTIHGQAILAQSHSCTNCLRIFGSSIEYYEHLKSCVSYPDFSS